MNNLSLSDLYRKAAETKHPLVFGHRGAMEYAPQNTLPSFALALEQGAEGIELDVQLSSDEVPVVIHDETVDACTDGSGFVSRHSLAQLKKLDAGSWFAPQFKDCRIPSLEEVFANYGDLLVINVELKYPANFKAPVEKLAEKTLEVITKHKLEHRVLVSSFHPLALRYFHTLTKNIPLAFLTATNLAVDTESLLGDLNFQAYHPEHTMTNKSLVEKHHRLNRWVNVWTVNKVEEVKRLLGLKVDGLISNNPKAVFEVLASQI